MGLTFEIGRTILPLVIVGGIAVFVVLRMKHKYDKGTLGKKKTNSSQNLLDSLIPLGIIIGFVTAILISLFSSISTLSSLVWGPGIGMLFGYFAYEVYSKTEDSYS